MSLLEIATSDGMLCAWFGGWDVQTNENISPSVLNRLIKEVKEYTKNPVSDIVLQVNEANVTDIRADLHGPGTTPPHPRPLGIYTRKAD